MTDTYRAYANQIPKEVRLAIDGLHGQDDLRYAVVVALFAEGPVSFDELQSELEVDEKRLSRALDALQRGGLIKKQVTGELGDRFSGHYRISDYGTRMLDGFYYATKPKYVNVENEGTSIGSAFVQPMGLPAEITSGTQAAGTADSLESVEMW